MNHCQKPSKQQLLSLINEVSFAINDMHLYLNTHPNDSNAMAFIQAKAKIRKEALKEYARHYGPLTMDTTAECTSQCWEWVMQPWPWEGGCR